VAVKFGKKEKGNKIAKKKILSYGYDELKIFKLIE
jgi:hypothetical protein